MLKIKKNKNKNQQVIHKYWHNTCCYLLEGLQWYKCYFQITVNGPEKSFACWVKQQTNEDLKHEFLQRHWALHRALGKNTDGMMLWRWSVPCLFNLTPTPQRKILSLFTAYEFYFPTTPLALGELSLEPCVFQTVDAHIIWISLKGRAAEGWVPKLHMREKNMMWRKIKHKCTDALLATALRVIQ